MKRIFGDKANISIRGKFLRDVLLELNLKSFTGRLLIKGKVIEGFLTLRIHLINGLPTYCLLNIEGGVLTSGKCIELIDRLLCMDCELKLEHAEINELVVDETLVIAYRGITEELEERSLTSILKNPLVQLYLIRYSSNVEILHGKLQKVLDELKTLSGNRAILAIIKGESITCTLVYYSSKLIHGVVTWYGLEEEQKKLTTKIIDEDTLGEIKHNYGLEVVDCTAYLINKEKLRKSGFQV